MKNIVQRQYIIICDKQPLKCENTAPQTIHITVYSMPGLTLHHTPDPLLTSTPPWECRWPVDSQWEGAHSVPCSPDGLPHCLTAYEMVCSPPTIFQREPCHSSRHHWLWCTSCRAVPREREKGKTHRIIHSIFFNHYPSPYLLSLTSFLSLSSAHFLKKSCQLSLATSGEVHFTGILPPLDL